MKSMALGALLAGALVALTGEARAQTNRPTATTTGGSGTYVERATSDGQDIRFEDDPVSALAGDPVGSILSVFQPMHRFDLMHPRGTFVPELLKSIEHM